jgi:glutaredoxin
MKPAFTRLLNALPWQGRPPVRRTEAEQARIEAACRDLALYSSWGCPFCSRVERTMRKLALPITRHDPRKSRSHAEALTRGGGKLQIPCLLIKTPLGKTQWLYESADIIRYLQRRFPS